MTKKLLLYDGCVMGGSAIRYCKASHPPPVTPLMPTSGSPRILTPITGGALALLAYGWKLRKREGSFYAILNAGIVGIAWFKAWRLHWH